MVYMWFPKTAPTSLQLCWTPPILNGKRSILFTSYTSLVPTLWNTPSPITHIMFIEACLEVLTTWTFSWLIYLLLGPSTVILKNPVEKSSQSRQLASSWLVFNDQKFSFLFFPFVLNYQKMEIIQSPNKLKPFMGFPLWVMWCWASPERVLLREPQLASFPTAWKGAVILF